MKRPSLLTGLLIEPADWRVGLNEVSAWWRDSVQYQDVAMICRDQHYWEWRFMAHPHVSYQLWRVKARVPWRRQAMAWFVTRSWSKNSHVLVDFVFRDGGRELEEKQACLDALAQTIGQGCSLYGWRVSAKTFPDTVVAMCFITVS